MMKIDDLKGKKIAILGYGREGKSTEGFLMKNGILPEQITVLDKSIDTDYLKNLEKYDVIFKTAGMPYFPEIEAVAGKVITQVQWFFDNFKGKVIAITASKGKTTITSMIYQLLQDAGLKVILAGNIGKPVLDQLSMSDFDNEDLYVVIELSSFMLEKLEKRNLISILGSIFPVHLDWHGSMANYVKAKGNILKGSEWNVMMKTSYEMKNLSDKDSSSRKRSGSEGQGDGKGQLILTGKGTPYVWNWGEIKLLGEHNLENISTVLAVADILQIDKDVVKNTIRNFEPVRHRLQKVGTFQGIDFYDDAISTSPFSSIAALDALGDKVDTLFLGGVDGWYDFSALVERIKKSKIRNLILFPDSGATIEKLLGEHNYNVFHTREMKDGVQFAYDNTERSKIALLSTATPSFSLWKDFEEKGDLFQKWVMELGRI